MEASAAMSEVAAGTARLRMITSLMALVAASALSACGGGSESGAAPESMFVMASRSLREGGWMQQAAEAAAKACDLNPDSEPARREKEIVDTWRTRLRA